MAMNSTPPQQTSVALVGGPLDGEELPFRGELSPTLVKQSVTYMLNQYSDTGEYVYSFIGSHGLNVHEEHHDDH